MRTFTFLTLLMVAACEGGLTGPEACQTFPTISLYVDEMERVAPCFTDESGAELTYAVVASDPEVADAELSGASIEITAYSPGESVITITASNQDGTGEVTILVEVPNRDPAVIGEPRSIQLSVGRYSSWILSDFFTEPDHQTLIYSAISEPSDLVGLNIAGDTLTVTGIAAGEAVVEITASDGSATASVTLDVEVRDLNVLFEDQFDNASGGWGRVADTGMEIRDGKLAVWSTKPWPILGIALKNVSAEDWEVSTRIRAGADSTNAMLGVRVVNSRYTLIELDVGIAADTDWSISMYDTEVRQWTYLGEGDFGLSAYDEWVDIRFWYRDDQYHLSLNNRDPISMGSAENTGSQISQLAFIAEHGYAGRPGQKVFMDEITVSGVRPESASYHADRSFPFRERKERR